MLVRAKVTHIQPGTFTYRNQGDEFDHAGKPYKHVEAVKKPKQEDETGEPAE